MEICGCQWNQVTSFTPVKKWDILLFFGLAVVQKVEQVVLFLAAPVCMPKYCWATKPQVVPDMFIGV